MKTSSSQPMGLRGWRRATTRPTPAYITTMAMPDQVPLVLS
jgi:hypothetical protein